MLELSGEDFKGTIINILKAIMNTLETNGKLEYLSKEIKDIKKESNGNLELKNTISKIKILTEWINSKVKITEEGVSKLEDKSIQIIQSEQQKENRLKKMNTASGACGKITKDLTLMLLKS